MTKLERALSEATKLPADMQEKLGDDLLHYIHKYLALREEIAIGVAELDRGETATAEEVFAKLKARYGG
jgi:predicted transcriptional regulator